MELIAEMKKDKNMKAKFDNYHFASSQILLQEAYQHWEKKQGSLSFRIGHLDYIPVFEDVNWADPDDIRLDEEKNTWNSEGKATFFSKQHGFEMKNKSDNRGGHRNL